MKKKYWINNFSIEIIWMIASFLVFIGNNIDSKYIYINYFIIIGDCILACISTYISVSKNDIKRLKQLLCIFIVLAIYFSSFFINKEIDIINRELFICIIFVLYTNIVLLCLNIRKSLLAFSIHKYISENWGIFLIIFIFVILSCLWIDSIAIWDSYCYYWGITDLHEFDASLSQLDSLGVITSHIDLSAGFFTRIGYNIFHGNIIGIRVSNIFVATISIICFYKLLLIFIRKDKEERHLIWLWTSVFAFSPYILGMNSNIDIDYYSMLYCVIFLYSFYSDNNLLLLLSGMAVAFAKENAMLYLFAFVFSYVLIIFVKNKKKLSYRLFDILNNFKLYILGSPFILWVIVYIGNGAKTWNDSENIYGGVGFNKKNIINKFYQIFAADNTWIITIMIIICLFFCLKYHYSIKIQNYYPMISMFICFVIFNMTYITYNHIRYIMFGYVFLLLFCALLCISIPIKIIIKKWVTILISACMLVQSFINIDPLMKIVYGAQTVGETKMYGTAAVGENTFQLSDTVIYNKQFLGWSKILEKFYEKTNEYQNVLYVYPDELGLFSFGGIGEKFADSSSYSRYISGEIDEQKYEYIALLIPNWYDNCQFKDFIHMSYKIEQIHYSILGWEAECFIIPFCQYRGGLLEINFAGEKYNAPYYIKEGCPVNEGEASWSIGKKMIVTVPVGDIYDSLNVKINICNTFNGKQRYSILQDNRCVVSDIIENNGFIEFEADVINGLLSFELYMPDAICVNLVDENNNDSREVAFLLDKMQIYDK